MSRIGEINYSTKGEKLIIIEYVNSTNISVQFEDGVIVKNRTYNDFIRRKIKHPIRYEESFAYYIEVELGLDLDKIWNWEKNNELGINPYKIYKQSNKKVWLYCLEKNYHNDYDGYEIMISNFIKGQRCSYCKKNKIHPKDSFAQWGIDNFGEDFLDKYWSSYNTLNPWEISPSCNKKIFLYCYNHDYHNYDENGNKIGYKISCSNFKNGNRCNYCNSKLIHYRDSLAYNYPNIAKMIAIKENNLTFKDCYNIGCQSGRKFYFKCLNCNKISLNKLCLSRIVKTFYSCRYCSDGISIPNKFMNNLLNQLNIKFEPEYSPCYFRNSQHVDFLLIDYNVIIEMDGNYGNHVREYDYWRDFLNMKYGGYKTIRIDLTDNNKYKKDLFNYLKKQILNSELFILLDLYNVDWKSIWEQCQNSLCVKTWILYNKGMSITEISNYLNIDRCTIREYIRRGKICNKITRV